jgi:hypothetical protein
MFESEGKEINSSEHDDTEIHRATAEKVRHAISNILDRKIEQLVEQLISAKDLEEAADQLFRIAGQGASTEVIEQRLVDLSSNIAAKLLQRGD